MKDTVNKLFIPYTINLMILTIIIEVQVEIKIFNVIYAMCKPTNNVNHLMSLKVVLNSNYLSRKGQRKDENIV
jgi:hypothetical protein